MKRVFWIFAIAIILCSCSGNSNNVYICTGPHSKCYHKSSRCRGLDNCSREVLQITKEEAESKYNRHPCQYCCGKIKEMAVSERVEEDVIAEEIVEEVVVGSITKCWEPGFDDQKDNVTILYEYLHNKGYINKNKSEEWFRNAMSTEEGVRSLYNFLKDIEGDNMIPYIEFEKRYRTYYIVIDEDYLEEYYEHVAP